MSYLNATQPVVLITGASRGLGLALANALGEAGCRLILTARDGRALHAAVRHLPTALAVPGDVTDPAHRLALAAIARREGGLTALVNNAGALGPSPLPAVDGIASADFLALLEANVVAPLALIAALGDALPAGARVVNVTSDAAVEAYPGWGPYGASKAALEQATRVLAAERPDWRVYAVDPGDMRTAMHQAAFPGEDITDRPLPEAVAPGFVRLLRGDLPSGRYRAAELASAGGPA